MNTLDKLISVSYEFETPLANVPPGQELIGKVFIRPKENIGYDTITIQLKQIITGKLNLSNTVKDFITLVSNGNWTKGRLYEYEIALTIPEDAFTFRGEYLEILWCLNLEIDPDKETMSKRRLNLLKDVELGRLFKTLKGKLNHTSFITVIPKTKNYVHNNQVYYFTNHFNEVLVAGIFLIVVPIGIYFSGTYGVLSYISGVLGLGLIGYSIYNGLSISQLGKISYGLTSYSEEEFSLDFSVQKNADKIQEIKFHYEIKEEVVDNRGTDSTRYRSSVFSSPIKTISNLKNYDLKLSYPHNFFPGSFSFKSAKIYWVLYVDIKFNNGLSYKINREININP